MIQKFEEFIAESAETNSFIKALIKYGASKEIFWDRNELKVYLKDAIEGKDGDKYPSVLIVSEGNGFVFAEMNKRADNTYVISILDDRMVSGYSEVNSPVELFERDPTDNSRFAFSDANARKIIKDLEGAKTINKGHNGI